VSYQQFDVVVVPFPFTDRPVTKKRPALVISDAGNFGDRIGHAVLAMITSAKNSPWPLDVAISNLAVAGLPAPSKVRMKLFTLDHRLILNRRGRLEETDAREVKIALARLLSWQP
jgi:mRNA interferase MazF